MFLSKLHVWHVESLKDHLQQHSEQLDGYKRPLTCTIDLLLTPIVNCGFLHHVVRMRRPPASSGFHSEATSMCCA